MKEKRLHQRKTRQARTEKAIRRRKNFLPTIFITMLFWALIAGIFYFIDPETPGILPIFFILIFLALTFTFSVLTASTRRGILSSFVLTIFLVLRYFAVGNLLNFAFLAGIALTVEVYFSITDRS